MNLPPTIRFTKASKRLLRTVFRFGSGLTFLTFFSSTPSFSFIATEASACISSVFVPMWLSLPFGSERAAEGPKQREKRKIFSQKEIIVTRISDMSYDIGEHARRREKPGIHLTYQKNYAIMGPDEGGSIKAEG